MRIHGIVSSVRACLIYSAYRRVSVYHRNLQYVLFALRTLTRQGLFVDLLRPFARMRIFLTGPLSLNVQHLLQARFCFAVFGEEDAHLRDSVVRESLFSLVGV